MLIPSCWKASRRETITKTSRYQSSSAKCVYYVVGKVKTTPVKTGRLALVTLRTPNSREHNTQTLCRRVCVPFNWNLCNRHQIDFYYTAVNATYALLAGENDRFAIKLTSTHMGFVRKRNMRICVHVWARFGRHFAPCIFTLCLQGDSVRSGALMRVTFAYANQMHDIYVHACAARAVIRFRCAWLICPRLRRRTRCCASDFAACGFQPPVMEQIYTCIPSICICLSIPHEENWSRHFDHVPEHTAGLNVNNCSLCGNRLDRKYGAHEIMSL